MDELIMVMMIRQMWALCLIMRAKGTRTSEVSNSGVRNSAVGHCSEWSCPRRKHFCALGNTTWVAKGRFAKLYNFHVITLGFLESIQCSSVTPVHCWAIQRIFSLSRRPLFPVIMSSERSEIQTCQVLKPPQEFLHGPTWPDLWDQNLGEEPVDMEWCSRSLHATWETPKINLLVINWIVTRWWQRLCPHCAGSVIACQIR